MYGRLFLPLIICHFIFNGEAWIYGVRRKCVTKTPKKQCPEVVSPLNGIKSEGGSEIGNTTAFNCLKGYNLCGKNITTCTNNGEWDNPIPSCVLEGNVHPNDTKVVFENSTYIFSSKENLQNLTDALKTCEGLCGSLVSINSPEEQAFIDKKAFELNSEDGWYIGLVKQNGSWKWTDGQDVTYTNWNVLSQPDKLTCVILYDSQFPPNSNVYKWLTTETCPLIYKNRFICEVV